MNIFILRFHICFYFMLIESVLDRGKNSQKIEPKDLVLGI